VKRETGAGFDPNACAAPATVSAQGFFTQPLSGKDGKAENLMREPGDRPEEARGLRRAVASISIEVAQPFFGPRFS
jgi:hypothetical protein